MWEFPPFLGRGGGLFLELNISVGTMNKRGAVVHRLAQMINFVYVCASGIIERELQQGAQK